MSKDLFNDFEGVSSKAWKQKIQVDLKGADYNDTLIWKTKEGIDVKPFYHSDEYDHVANTTRTHSTNWKVCQYIVVDEKTDANATARDAIKRGAESIIFEINSESIGLNTLFTNIDLQKIKVFLKSNFLSDQYMLETYDITKGNVTYLTDIIGNLAKTGNWFKSLNDDHLKFDHIVEVTNQTTIDLCLYQNAGANITQQLAYALSHANEYLNHLDDKLSSVCKEDLKITFTTCVGSNYFFEIAKLRALRNMWSTLAQEYGVNQNCQIIATPSKRNKTIYDYNVNLLRTTTECMSAVLGGADVVYNLPYDSLYHKPNEFGDRISRNQLLVLKKESYLDKVNNPSDGAYYIESLTRQLGEKALELFKDIESNGGFLAQLKSGTIQRKIKESAGKEQDDFDNGKIVLLGTNKHPNPNDKMKNDLERSPFLQKEIRKTLIEPIIEKRLSEKLEISRLNEE